MNSEIHLADVGSLATEPVPPNPILGVPDRSGEWICTRFNADALPPEIRSRWEAAAHHPIAQPFVPMLCWSHLGQRDAPLHAFRISSAGHGGVGFVALARVGRLLRCWMAPCHSEVGRVDFALDGDAKSLLGPLLDEVLVRGPADVLEAPCMTQDSPAYTGLKAAAEQRGLRWVEDLVCDVPMKRLEGDWDAFWCSIGGSTRRKFGQQQRRLEKQGRLEFAEVRGGDGLDRLFDECLEVEASGYKGATRTALRYREAEQRFWRAFVPAAATAGTLSIYTLRLDGRLISYEICMKHSGVIYAMKHGTDVRVEAQAPGNVLHRMLFQHEIERGEFHLYDFAGEMVEWKRRWTKDVVPMYRVRVYAPHWRAGLAYLLGPGLRRMLKRVPGTMRLMNWLRRPRRLRAAAAAAEPEAGSGSSDAQET